MSLMKLFQQGERRLRHLGEFLRKRYNSIWPPKQRLYVRSSKEERCIKSVQSLINGAYNDDFLLSPVPIVTLPVHDDSMLNPKSLCPMYDTETNRIFNLPDNHDWFESYKPLQSYLSGKSGIKIETLRNTLLFFDNLYANREHNLTLPNWVNETIYQQLDNLFDRDYELLHQTKLQQRLRGGMLLKEIRKQMNLIQKHKKFDAVRLYATVSKIECIKH
ncbi:venom acid phosphatase Acph-1-like protein [Leptotrombidium deliense]|uniref:Venom acid phosphatase Acph-1-like protein n=1 Tax=Leptotrombidium deliense TaxID=299467 RepID=A0A443S203_9ACAR|nr:venom acid phosphatase Acph-1-like protein [Leptotrombidium deliense]